MEIMKLIETLLLAMIVGVWLLVPIPSAFAQTWTKAGVPTNNIGWVAVASSADASKLIAGGQFYIFSISTNSGNTWITNTEPQKGSTYGCWSCIA